MKTPVMKLPVKPPTADDVVAAMRRFENPRRAAKLGTFFQTGPGGYGYRGDRFLGVMVPLSRQMAKKFADLPLNQAQRLLRSPWHEPRLTALFILINHYARGDATTRERVYRIYLKNRRRVNNWDLVDASAHYILGPHADATGDLSDLHRLARSDRWYERRIAMVATFHFIRKKRFGPTLALAERLLSDDHDLMHKAVGWMLREMGNRDRATLRRFLDARAGAMPRTMLRYAIEKLPPGERKKYMKQPRSAAVSRAKKAAS